MIDPPWSIALLGRFAMERDGDIVTRFRTQKAGALLAYLTYFKRQPHLRDVLIERFWPNSDLESAHNNFRVALNILRRRLEPPGVIPGAVLIADRTNVQIHPTACITDIAEFETALQAARRSTSDADQLMFLMKAVELYGGELLPGYEDAWVMTERQHLSDSYLEALRRLIKHLVQVREFDQAIGFARRAIGIDPMREESHRTLMRLYAAMGRPAVALQHYRELERILKQNSGIEPSPLSRDLARELAKGSGEITIAPGGSRVSLPVTVSEAVVSYRSSPGIPSPGPSSPDPIDNLPRTWTRFFGREEELHQIQGMLLTSATRLVTLTGTAGVGKTRLAIEAARQIRDAYSREIYYVSLAALPDASRITDTILEALRLPRSPDKEPLDQIIAFLKPGDAQRATLLVLDNFERLVEEGVLIVRALLERAPSLICMVTSRQRLEIVGEQEFLVLPLPTPAVSETSAHLIEFACVQLFIDRAQAVRQRFRVTSTNARAVAALCARLEGLPLAIELAAARADALTPEQMLSRLSRRFEWLTSDSKELLPHHRTLRASIAWSYHLLAPELQHFFASLSVFHGGWTLEAAEAMTRPDAPHESTPQSLAILDYLTQLRRRSLVIAEESGEEMRFHLLETLREYASEQLEAGERADLTRRHVTYFMQIAEHAQPHLLGPDQALWLERLEAEHDNLRAAIAYCIVDANYVETGMRLAVALWRFWEIRCHFKEGREWLERLLTKSLERTTLRARALHGAGVMAGNQTDYVAAYSHFEETLAIYRELGNKGGVSKALICQAIVAKHLGDYDLAHKLLEESLVTLQERGDKEGVATVLMNLASVAFYQTDYVAARMIYEESLAMYRALGNERFVALTLIPLGSIACAEQQFATGRTIYEEALAILKKLGDTRSIANTLMNLGNVTYYQRDYARAHLFCVDGLALYQSLGETAGVASFLDVTSFGASLQEQPFRAIRLHGSAQALREVIGVSLAPNEQADRAIHLAAARDVLGEQAYAEAEASGRAMTAEQAVAYAMEAHREETKPE